MNIIPIFKPATKTLKGKTVIVTGSSRGIGREIALLCAADGANIVITGKTASPSILCGRKR